MFFFQGLLFVSKAVCPGMVERGEGVIGITGATASLRGRPIASAFAPAKVNILVNVVQQLYNLDISILHPSSAQRVLSK